MNFKDFKIILFCFGAFIFFMFAFPFILLAASLSYLKLIGTEKFNSWKRNLR